MSEYDKRSNLGKVNGVALEQKAYCGHMVHQHGVKVLQKQRQPFIYVMPHKMNEEKRTEGVTHKM